MPPEASSSVYLKKQLSLQDWTKVLAWAKSMEGIDMVHLFLATCGMHTAANDAVDVFRYLWLLICISTNLSCCTNLEHASKDDVYCRRQKIHGRLLHRPETVPKPKVKLHPLSLLG